MCDQDRLVIDLQLSFEHSSSGLTASRQIYSLERYIGPIIISEQNRYSFVEVSVDFIKTRPAFDIDLNFEVDASVQYKSNSFKEGELVHWNLDMCVHSAVSLFTDWLIPYHRYVRTHTSATLTIRRALFNLSVAEIEVEFMPNEFGDDRAVGLEGCGHFLHVAFRSCWNVFADRKHRVIVNFVCGRSKSVGH